MEQAILWAIILASVPIAVFMLVLIYIVGLLLVQQVLDRRRVRRMMDRWAHWQDMV